MKKYVLTGGPCSGKTSILEELERRNYFVIHESAKEIIKKRKEKELTYRDHLIRQELIFQRQLNLERIYDKKYRSNDSLFVDRGLIDTLAYFSYFDLKIPGVLLGFNLKDRYRKIFFLNRLPFKKEEFRLEDSEEEAQKIHKIILKTYSDYGYEVIPVQVMNVEKRTDFILEEIARK